MMRAGPPTTRHHLARPETFKIAVEKKMPVDENSTPGQLLTVRAKSSGQQKATKDGKIAAELLIARLAQCKTSPTVLFWLKLRPKYFGLTELGSSLLRLCTEHDVVHSPNSAFFLSVKEKCEKFPPIAPDFFVVSRKKVEAVKNFREELRRRFILDGGRTDPFMYMGAFMPFCFQCLCAKTDSSKYPARSLFFIFATPEDGMRKILEVFRRGEYFYDGRLYVFTQVYEHRLGEAFAPEISGAATAAAIKEREDNREGYMLLDWEVEEEKVQGRLTRDEIKALMEEFPTWFYKKMHALKLVDHDAYVTGAAECLHLVYFYFI